MQGDKTRPVERRYTFEVEVVIRSPEDVDRFEAEEDAESFLKSSMRSMGMVGKSFGFFSGISELKKAAKVKSGEIQK
jgi:hypothetical protein